MAVGMADKTVRVLSLDPETPMQRVCNQAMPDDPLALALVDMSDGEASGNYFLHVGLANGVLLRTVVDSVTGMVSDTRSKYLGN